MPACGVIVSPLSRRFAGARFLDEHNSFQSGAWECDRITGEIS
jgi:hypothetical protein